MIWIKSHWKLVLIGIGILILLSWVGSITGTNRKLYNMMLNQFRTDQSRIIRVMEENMKTYETEIVRLNKEVESVQREKTIERAKAEQSAAEVTRLKGKINELQIQIQNIIISDDPDLILDDIRKLGFGSIRKYSN